LALWMQCRGGVGMHMWPMLEIAELIDPATGVRMNKLGVGELVWTGIGWFATAMVRLRTHKNVVINEMRCPSCGSNAPRVEPSTLPGGFSGALNSNPMVAQWYAELKNKSIPVQKDTQSSSRKLLNMQRSSSARSTPRSTRETELDICLALTETGNAMALLEEIVHQIGNASVHVMDVDQVQLKVDVAGGRNFVDLTHVDEFGNERIDESFIAAPQKKQKA